MQKYITKLLKYGTLISTYGLIGSVLLQIFARFFLANTPAWTEETSRLFFIYAMAFAAGLALKSDEYVALDLFFEKFSPALQKRLLLLVQGLIVLLFGIMAVFSLQFVQLGLPESSPSMAISMSVAFFSMFLMSASICYFACLEIQKIRKKINR
ncbi:MAG: TRAP transporter small permease subunit [Bacteroidota bacterium]